VSFSRFAVIASLMISPSSIDRAVMESAAGDHQVVMGAMDVGWSDLGGWSALLAAIAGGDAAGAHGRVVQTGETVHLGDDDLVVRAPGGHLEVDTAGEVETGSDGTVVADGVWAHLSGALPLADQVRALIDRVDRQEVRA
jgi:hypothetical protein